MKLLLLAGEESGMKYRDMIAAKFLADNPGSEIRGYGDYGFQTGDLAVMGLWQVLSRIFYFIRVKRTMLRAIDEWRPDVVCTIDYPGMNLRLAAHAKAKGIRTVHVVCPQVWAWKRGRIPKIEASLDALCCFFPFEPELFSPGFATFVGHPLAKGDGGIGKKDVSGGERLLAVLPGSRAGEVRHHMPILLKVVAELRREMPGLRAIVPAANEKVEILIRKMANGAVDVQSGGARDLLRRADAAVVASGTATLEAALAGCPTVLVYKVDILFEIICRVVLKGIRHIGLVNILCEKTPDAPPCPMPELIQQDFTMENVVSHLRPWLTDIAANAEARAALSAAAGLLRSGSDPIAKIAAMCRTAAQ